MEVEKTYSLSRLDPKGEYTWGELYETLKEFNEPIEDELFQRFFKLVDDLENEADPNNFVNTIKSIIFTETEINRINSLCLDGLFDFAKAYDSPPMKKFLETTAYKDTVNFIISKKFEFFHWRYILFLCRNPNRLCFDIATVLNQDTEPMPAIANIYEEICENKVHISVVKKFIEMCPEIVIKYPMFFVKACMYSDTIEYLVRHCADIHINDEYPLYISTQLKRKDIVQFLLNNGAKIIPNRELVTFINEGFYNRKYVIKPDPEALLREKEL